MSTKSFCGICPLTFNPINLENSPCYKRSGESTFYGSEKVTAKQGNLKVQWYVYMYVGVVVFKSL